MRVFTAEEIRSVAIKYWRGMPLTNHDYAVFEHHPNQIIAELQDLTATVPRNSEPEPPVLRLKV